MNLVMFTAGRGDIVNGTTLEGWVLWIAARAYIEGAVNSTLRTITPAGVINNEIQTRYKVLNPRHQPL